MSILDIKLRTPRREHLMRMDLDPALRSEESILSFIRAGVLYEADVADVFLRAVRDGDTVFDVGANVGFFTLLGAFLAGPTGRVVSFEPAAENLRRLAANIALNDVANITVVEQPVSDGIEDTAFHLNSDNAGGHSLWAPGNFPANAKSREAPRSIAMRTTTIDAEVARLNLAPPRVIKIDTEGAEHKVLAGAAGLLQGRKVPYIVAELHEFGLQQMGSSQAALRGFMAEFGYETFLLYLDGSLPRLAPRATRISSPFFLNLLFSTPENVAALWPTVTHQIAPGLVKTAPSIVPVQP